jgi:hypothetical protein
VTRRGWTLLVAAAALAAAFAYQNREERAALEIGPLDLYAIPLAVLVFAAFLLAMAAMYFLSLPTDRRTRELLRAHGLLDAPLDAQAPRSVRPAPVRSHSDPPSPPPPPYSGY